MPKVVPPSGRIYVWLTSRLPAESGGGGLAEYFATAGSEWKWNNSTEPEWSYRCELSNYTSRVLLNVELTMHATFFEASLVPNQPNSYSHGKVTLDRDWMVPIAKIDPGPQQPFVFFIWNCCVENFVRVSAPATATAESPNATSRQELVVKQSSGNLSTP